MLPLVDSHEMPELFEVLGTATSQLVEEIKSQRTLIDAESGDLTVEQLVIDADSLVDDVVGFYRSHDVAREKHIVIESDVKAWRRSSPRIRHWCGASSGTSSRMHSKRPNRG